MKSGGWTSAIGQQSIKPISSDDGDEQGKVRPELLERFRPCRRIKSWRKRGSRLIGKRWTTSEYPENGEIMKNFTLPLRIVGRGTRFYAGGNRFLIFFFSPNNFCPTPKGYYLLGSFIFRRHSTGRILQPRSRFNNLGKKHSDVVTLLYTCTINSGKKRAYCFRGTRVGYKQIHPVHCVFCGTFPM